MLGVAPIIAIVEPDVACRGMLRELLEEEGHRVCSCATADEAHILFAHTQPDVVILDIGLATTSTDGGVLRVLPSVDSLFRKPVILCSTDPQYLGAHEHNLRTVGSALLAMPFDIDTVVRLVQEALHPVSE